IAQTAAELARKVAAGEIEADTIDEHSFSEAMPSRDLPPLDLLIRTGGEQRISNFLLWQAAYAELYYTQLLWPDFDAEALHQAADDFFRRQRRFGQTSEQLGQASIATVRGLPNA